MAKSIHSNKLDDSLSLIMKGENMNGIATKNPNILFANTNTAYFRKVLEQLTDAYLSEHNLGYLYKTMIGENHLPNTYTKLLKRIKAILNISRTLLEDN